MSGVKPTAFEMRTETQVLQQILAFAGQHNAIRAVSMNGSRVNPNAPQDLFCDYDVVCFTCEPRQFVQDQAWIAFFGDLIMLQQNDFEEHGEPGFIFLMLFTDGVRIDLSFQALSNLAHLGEDTLTRVLLDKDLRLAPLPPPSDAGYFLPKPSPQEFAAALNEIFWCSNNIAKGLWRGELAYVKSMFDSVVREPLVLLLSWYAAWQHDWALDTGKFGKWLQRFLPAEVWQAYLQTYAGAGEAENWEALLAALALVRRVGQELAAALGYAYPLEDDQRMIVYLRTVRALPKDARSYDGG